MVADNPPMQFGELYGHEFMWGDGRYGSDLWNRHMDTATWRSIGNVWRCLQPFCSGWQMYDPHLYPRLGISHGLPSHSRAEVAHRCCDPPGASGVWFFHAPGSGIWYDLGRTLVMAVHGSVTQKLDRSLTCFEDGACFTRVVAAARREGYDSLIFTAYHDEHVIEYEIIDLSLIHI